MINSTMVTATKKATEETMFDVIALVINETGYIRVVNDLSNGEVIGDLFKSYWLAAKHSERETKRVAYTDGNGLQVLIGPFAFGIEDDHGATCIELDI